MVVFRCCNSVVFSSSVLCRSRAAVSPVLKVLCDLVMLVLIFVGLVLPIAVADVVGKKERQSQMLSLL